MKLIIDISKERYNEIMSMDWKNCRLIFDEEIRAIHDGKALEQEPCEDATKHFKNVYELSQTLGVSYDFVNEKIQEMLMALKTKPLILSPVTPQPCEDAISRQAVLEVIEKCHCEEWVKADIGAPIEALQPVTPAEKVGRWIPTGYDGYADGNPVYDWWECSECGWEHTGDEDTLTPYCPNCGNRMMWEVEE